MSTFFRYVWYGVVAGLWVIVFMLLLLLGVIVHGNSVANLEPVGETELSSFLIKSPYASCVKPTLKAQIEANDIPYVSNKALGVAEKICADKEVANRQLRLL